MMVYYEGHQAGFPASPVRTKARLREAFTCTGRYPG